MRKVSVIVPAYNEEAYIEETLRAIQDSDWANELIVVNDGSSDETGTVATRFADVYISFNENQGKGDALKAAFRHVTHDIIVCLDADLGQTAKEGRKLVEPLFIDEHVDGVIGMLPVQRKRGFGIVRKRASSIIYKQTGVYVHAPLSGQRSFRKKWLKKLEETPFYRYGVETVMTLVMLQEGANLIEVDVSMSHRQHGKSITGLLHRAKQWYDIEKSVWQSCRF